MSPLLTQPKQDLLLQFQQLDQLLLELKPYWQLRPFAEMALPWTHNPPLLGYLQQLKPDQVTALEEDMAARLAALSPFIDNIDALHALINTSTLPVNSPVSVEPLLSYGVPGRKWRQVQAFSAALPQESRPFLEWCAGKGHLGRVLHQVHGGTVTSLELQASLCRDGEALAERHHSSCQMVTCDVLSDAVEPHLSPNQHAVALHACGQLHLQLLQRASAKGVERISLSPCCYHLIDSDHYQPISPSGAASALKLTRHDLRLVVQETVTAGARERRQRNREFHWRLGFDLLQRQLRGVDDYLNCPPVPRRVMGGDFAGFCRYMAQRKQLCLQQPIDYDAFEARGVERADTVARIELVRHLFRRPLELWLVLDRALFLQQQGYSVRLGEFCDYQLTPRNLMILASKG
ncbi:methyltransferase [Aestuariirhabdus sp. LZHN29]|uniref:methyltransferase n=1 Tax=Aestuariirhabdus sp. LZHN29 TaxID=3417462 RepID=UPI003CF25346